eukprot:m.63696 g.63696  ORF g.63696 m.63696 type:complete len:251 (-) comp11454_c1_seq8:30-782(-)
MGGLFLLSYIEFDLFRPLFQINALHRSSAPGVEPPDNVSLKELILWMNRHVPDSADITVNLSARNLFRSVPANSSVLDVLTLMSEKNVKRVAVIDPVSHKIVKLITQSSITKMLIKDHEEVLKLLGNATVASTNMGFIDDMKTVSSTAAAVNAFEAMDKYSISAIPVIDRKQDNKLVAVISDTDLRALVTKDGFKVYGINVTEFLKIIKPDDPFKVFSVTSKTPIGAVVVKEPNTFIMCHHVHVHVSSCT